MTLKANKIYHGECSEIMASFPTHSVDCVFADPPYNLQLSKTLRRPDDTVVDGVYDDWDKFSTFQDYDLFTVQWLSQVKRILKPTGSLWVIGTYHNIFRIGKALQDLGFWIINDIIWRKTNPMPNFKGTRFTNAHETLIWCTAEKTGKYQFNYESLKNLNDGKQMRSDWFFPICSSAERLKDKSGQKVHSTQKPEELLYRILLSCTKQNSLVLDPFFGTGTTGAVARKLNRDFIGIDINANYIKQAKKRISLISPTKSETVFNIVNKRDLPRIPFGSLLEKGYLEPGDILMDKKEKYKAIICSDSLLSLDNFKGSIHQAAAFIQNKSSSNGWDYWHYQENNKLIPLTSLRDKIWACL